MTSEANDSKPEVDAGPGEEMLQTWRAAFGDLLERLREVSAERGFDNNEFRAAVKNNRDAFQELFSSEEVGGSKDEIGGLSAWVGERERYIIILIALATFVGTFDKLGGKHIFDLASRFSDLNKGHDHPLFEPAKVGNRRRDRSLLWQSRARITLAVEARIRCRVGPADAEAEIAGLLGREIFAFAGKRAAKSEPVSILRNWRKAFNNNRVSDLEARIVFEEGLAKITKAIVEGDGRTIEDIVQNVAGAAALGGVLSPPFTHP
jgi:hypothetical protein